MNEAARYCTNLTDPQAIAKLAQAALTASGTIAFAQKNLNPEDWATVPDWIAVQRELLQALQAIGHPADGTYLIGIHRGMQ